MTRRLLSAACALALLLSVPAGEPARAGDTVPADDSSQHLALAFKGLQMGAGIPADQLILFPLYATSELGPVGVSAAVSGAAGPVVFSEPEPKLGKVTVRATNGGATPALVLAGTLIEGGRRDRMVRFDRLIPANDSIEIEVLPASMAKDKRDQGSEFRIADFLAPSYLRENAYLSADSSLVPRFVSHFLEFRDRGDKRESLLAIGDSDALADYCLTCQRSFADWPMKKGPGMAIGEILVVRGRVQSMEIFASNEHLQAFLEPLLKSLAFPSAAIALRAKKLNLPLPWEGDLATTLATATKASTELLASFSTAVYSRRTTEPGFVGEAWVLHLKDGGRGSALVHEGRLLHAAVYPGDPFDTALYAKPLDPLGPEDSTTGGGDEVGRAELERLAARGARLTPAELRLLERMRERQPAPR